jgi:hypothetical protein
MVLVGSQHPSEASGAAALQIYAHQVLQGPLRDHLESMNLVILPNSNPDGLEKKTRTNANDVNLSTDYLLLSQPESQSLVNLLRRYEPHALLDLHESAVWKKSSLGEEGYLTDFEAQVEYANQANIDGRLQTFSADKLLPDILRSLNQKGLRASRYIGEITSLKQPITHGGNTLHNLRNYAGYRGIISILIENRIDPPGNYPSYKNIKARTEKQYLSLLTLLEQVLAKRDKIIGLSNAAKNDWQDERGGRTVYLRSSYTRDPEEPFITIPLRNKLTNRLENIRYRNHTRLTESDPMDLPTAYAVTEEEGVISALLDRHGIRYEVLTKPKKAEVVIRRVKKLTITPGRAIEGRIITQEVEPDVVSTSKVIELAPEDLIVDMHQPMGRLLPEAFEPYSTNSIYRSALYTMLLVRYEDFFVMPVKKFP